ncbi:12954_t:CDS:2, partial [Dentiscutata erythropus]
GLAENILENSHNSNENSIGKDPMANTLDTFDNPNITLENLHNSNENSIGKKHKLLAPNTLDTFDNPNNISNAANPIIIVEYDSTLHNPKEKVIESIELESD